MSTARSASRPSVAARSGPERQARSRAQVPGNQDPSASIDTGHDRARVSEKTKARELRAERFAMTTLAGLFLLICVCQLGLLFDVLAPLRVLLRTAAIVTSLILGFVIGGRLLSHPSQKYAVLIMALLGLQLLHQSTNSLFVGIAQIALYASILAPLFWVLRLRVTQRVYLRLIAILLIWHGLSSAFGVLQVYFPGRFQPRLSSVLDTKGDVLQSLKIRLNDGREIWRPMGLSDVPGGAAQSGFFVFLLSLGVFVNDDRAGRRLLAVAGMLIGMFCIYLCQVRSTLVLSVVVAAGFGVVLSIRGHRWRTARLLFIAPAVIVASLYWAISQGGDAVTNRISTLTEDRATTVYHQSRGRFLQETIENLMPEYPFGAGLGRWGMMRQYFGDHFNRDSPALWVEIQVTGWLLDGGIPMIVLYSLAFFSACFATFRIALTSPSASIADWAALQCGYNLGIFALTFSYVPFIGQVGLEFWLLNAVLYGAAATTAAGGSRSLREIRRRPVTMGTPRPALAAPGGGS